MSDRSQFPEGGPQFELPLRFRLYDLLSQYFQAMDLEAQVRSSVMPGLSLAEVSLLHYEGQVQGCPLPGLGSDAVSLGDVWFATLDRQGTDNQDLLYERLLAAPMSNHDFISIAVNLYRDSSPYVPEGQGFSFNTVDTPPDNFTILLGREMPVTLIQSENFENYFEGKRVASVELGDEDCQAIWRLITQAGPPASVE